MVHRRLFGSQRRRLLTSAASLAAALTLATSGPVWSAETPEWGGTLNVALRLTTASLDPLFGNAPGADRKIYNVFAETLLTQDSKGQLHPVLAESWTIADNGLYIDFKLREGVKFQDGTPFDATAAKANLDRLLDPNVKAPSKQYVADLKSVEVLGPLSLRVNLHRRSGVMLSMLASEPGSMVSPTALAERGADFSRRPVGTGPFTITSWSGNEIKAERNPHYWRRAPDGKPLPYLDRVHLKVVANSAIRIVELKSGNSQLVDFLGAKDFPQIENQAGLTLLPGAVPVTQLLAFNITRPPLDDPKLRQAIALGLDRKAISQVIAKGVGEPLNSLEPPGSWVHDTSVRGHEQNLEKARELYRESSHKGPITLSAIQRDPDTQIAQLVQSMLKRVGIEVRIEMLERQAWLAKILPHQYELGLLQFAVLRADPDTSYSDFFGPTAARNYSGVDTTKVLAPLVAEAREQSDIASRKRLYGQIQQSVLDEYLLSPLFWQPMRDAASVRLQGLERDAAGAWFYHGLWLKD